jgi:spastin
MKSKFYTLSASTLLQKHVGESEKILQALFKAAEITQPSIIFIDEIDAFLTKRTEGEQPYLRRLKTEFLVCLDGIGSGGKIFNFSP